MSSNQKKLVVLGGTRVGKTALVRRFVRGDFTDRYMNTAGWDSYRKSVDVEGQAVELVILDVASRVMNIYPSYLSSTDGVVLVCDISNPTGKDDVMRWNSLVKNNLGNVPTIIACNKIDLDGDEPCRTLEETGFRVVMTSAKTGENVETLFMELVKRILRASEK